MVRTSASHAEYSSSNLLGVTNSLPLSASPQTPLLSQAFLSRPAQVVAPALLGKLLVRDEVVLRGDIENGNLARVLPGWTGVGIPVSIVSPVSIAATARLKLVSDYIAAAIQKELD